MSLPSGLIFFLDFTYAQGKVALAKQGASVYGGGRVGSELTGGVQLNSVSASQAGFYNLNNGYASPTGSVTTEFQFVASGTYGKPADGFVKFKGAGAGYSTAEDFAKLLRYDPLFISGTTTAAVYRLTSIKSTLVQGSNNSHVNLDDLVGITVNNGVSGSGVQCRWLNAFSGTNAGRLGADDDHSDPGMYVVFADINGSDVLALGS